MSRCSFWLSLFVRFQTDKASGIREVQELAAYELVEQIDCFATLKEDKESMGNARKREARDSDVQLYTDGGSCVGGASVACDLAERGRSAGRA